MQRSSESIAQLAAALAKAQGELINPEKSLTATIKTDDGAAQQIFRYAPYRAGWRLCARRWASTKLPLCRPRPRILRPG